MQMRKAVWTYPLEIDNANEQGTARVLAPGVLLEAQMALRVETDLSKVSGLWQSKGFVE